MWVADHRDHPGLPRGRPRGGPPDHRRTARSGTRSASPRCRRSVPRCWCSSVVRTKRGNGAAGARRRPLVVGPPGRLARGRGPRPRLSRAAPSGPAPTRRSERPATGGPPSRSASPAGWVTVVALHMYGVAAADTLAVWLPVVAAGVRVVSVESTLVDGDGYPCWDARDLALRDVRAGVAAAPDDVPLVLAGASQGAGLAASAALNGEVRADGLARGGRRAAARCRPDDAMCRARWSPGGGPAAGRQPARLPRRGAGRRWPARGRRSPASATRTPPTGQSALLLSLNESCPSPSVRTHAQPHDSQAAPAR